MHILLITINYPNSYNEQSHVFFKEQAESLAKDGVCIGVLSVISISILTILKKGIKKFGLNESGQNGVKTMIFQYPALPKFYWLNFKLKKYIGKWLFKKYIKKHGTPDLIHNHVSLIGELIIWIRKKYNIPYVVTEHYSTFLQKKIPTWRKRIAKRVFENSNKNIAVSNFLADRLTALFNEGFEYIPNIVDTSFFKPVSSSSEINPEKIFLNIGNLIPGKNQVMLIEAFSRSFKNNMQYKLIIAGSGPEYHRLESKISNLDMHNQITLFGQATRTQVLNLMQKASFFVLSSHYETFGVVLIEAMACGLPVISTKCGGPESIIVNNNLGELCSIDPDSMSASMMTVISKTYDQSFIRYYAVNNFSGDAISKHLIKIYEGEIIC